MGRIISAGYEIRKGGAVWNEIKGMDQDNQIREVRFCDNWLMGKGYAVKGVSLFSAHLPGVLSGGVAGGEQDRDLSLSVAR